MGHLEKTAARVAGLVLGYQNKGESLIWTVSMIAKFLSVDPLDVAASIRWMRKNAYMYLHQGQMGITSDGKSWYGVLSRTSGVASGYHGYKEEVLTGAVESKSDGGFRTLVPTSKENAVLPKKIDGDKSSKNREPDVMSTGQIIAELARMTGLSKRQVGGYLTDGRVRICKGLDGNRHVGVFDRNGKYLRSLCKKCRAKQHQRRKVKKEKRDAGE